MVSNQVVTRSLGSAAGIVTSLALLLLSGCAMFKKAPAPSEAVDEPVVTTVSTASVKEETPWEAALAREPADASSIAPVATPNPAPGPVLNPNAPTATWSSGGDTLWGISAMFPA